MDEIRSYDWAGMTHAKGSAGDIPDQIESLIFSHDVNRKKALTTLIDLALYNGTTNTKFKHLTEFRKGISGHSILSRIPHQNS